MARTVVRVIEIFEVRRETLVAVKTDDPALAVRSVEGNWDVMADRFDHLQPKPIETWKRTSLTAQIPT